MKYSDHAYQRCAQRAISPSFMEDIVCLGREIYLGERRLAFLYAGHVAICDVESGKVITAFKLHSSPKRFRKRKQHVLTKAA